MSALAIRALLSGLVDYAGLFPPAALSMPEAVANYATYRTGADAWALGRFVVPVGRLDEFEGVAVGMFGGAPWRLSVLAQGGDIEVIRTFNARHDGRAIIDAVEAKATTIAELSTLTSMSGLGDIFVEIPIADDPGELVRAIGAHGLFAKVRTGGITGSAFPTARQVARFLAACARHDVTFKATAGLHHPLRGEYALTYAPDAERGTMFGYLNVFLAAAFLRHGMPESDAAALLEERDAAALHFDGDTLRWRDHALTAAALATIRSTFARSFGSCSFREPMDYLTALGLT
jgi:hypothetical protein